MKGIIQTNDAKKTGSCLLLVLAVCAVMLLASACGAKYADSEYLGTWKAASASMSGISLDLSKSVGEFSLTLNEDGSVDAVVGEDKEKGKWEETDQGFKIKDSSAEMEFQKTDNGKVKTEYQGMNITFEKK